MSSFQTPASSVFFQNERRESDDPATAVCTPRSSMTFTNNEAATLHLPSPLQASTSDETKPEPDLNSIYSQSSAPQAGDSSKEKLSSDPNLVDWDGPDDPENPQNWSVGYKWMITMICVLLCVNVTFASSAPATLSLKIAAHFDVSDTVSYLITSVFLLGYCFGPLIWGPGSEVIGRQYTFYLSMFFYTVFILGQALAQNMETLLITRFLSGFFGCAPLTNSGGVIADIWDAKGRGLAASLFTASVFMGPVIGPIVSGFIANSPVTWRWVFWVMIIFAGVCSSTVLFVPETYAPVLLARKAQRLRKQDPIVNKDLYGEHERQDSTFLGLVERTVQKPFTMLAKEPILLLVTIYLSLVFGLLYALFQAIPIIFIKGKGFNMAESGLIFIGVGIGTTLGSIMFLATAAIYPPLIVKWRGFPPPEYRLYAGMIGSPLLIIGCFWLGWTGQYPSVPWYVPAISTIFIGTGIASIFMSFLAYLVDTYVTSSASALAANTVVRSAVAAAFPLFTVRMFERLKINWACSLIGFIMLAFAPAPFLFFKYGAKIRANSTFAPCIDLKIAAEIAEEERNAKEKLDATVNV